jgi:hypothetical protein
VQPKQYALQQLKVAPKHVQLSPEDLARHEREREHLQAGCSTGRRPRRSTLRLQTPAPGRRSSSFGLRRVFNGEARNPHTGMDIAAPVGTPIVAAAAGAVIDSRRVLLQRPHGDRRSRPGLPDAVLPPRRDRREPARGLRRASRSARSAPPAA